MWKEDSGKCLVLIPVNVFMPVAIDDGELGKVYIYIYMFLEANLL